MLSHSHSCHVGCFYPIENTIILASIPLWNTNTEKAIAEPALVRVSKSTITRLGQRSIQAMMPELLEVINKGLNKSLCDISKLHPFRFWPSGQGEHSSLDLRHKSQAKIVVAHRAARRNHRLQVCCTNVLHMMALRALR